MTDYFVIIEIIRFSLTPYFHSDLSLCGFLGKLRAVASLLSYLTVDGYHCSMHKLFNNE